jgi:hypothetical protein
MEIGFSSASVSPAVLGFGDAQSPPARRATEKTHSPLEWLPYA